MQHKHIDAKADIVIVHAGANDIQSLTPEQLAEDIATNLKEIKSKCSKRTQVVFLLLSKERTTMNSMQRSLT